MIEPWVWALMLLVVATGLAVLELFVPSSGILAFLSIASVVGSLIMAFKSGPVVGLVFVVIVILGLPIGLALAVKWWPHTPIGRRILLTVARSDEVLPDNEFHRGLKTLIGRTGLAKTKMLPSGAILVDGRTIDASTEGLPIEPGQRVVVVAVQGTNVLVRPLEDDELPPAPDQKGLAQPIDSIAPDPFKDSTA
ncbi:MAG: NfeD family protein [Thermoguttaceae bacterium]